MKLKSVQYVLAFLLTLVASANAWALATCTATNVNYSPTYLPTATTDNVTANLSFSVTCVRDNSGNNGSDVSYTVTADNGTHIGSGTQNRAQNSNGNFLNYELYKNSNCTSEFEGANTFGATYLNTSKNTTLGTATYNFTGCITKQQILAGPGPYNDFNVTLTVAVTTVGGTGGVLGVPGSVAVAIATPATCAMTTLPGNIALNYTAFQAVAARQNTLFRATCTGGLAYTMKITNVDNTANVTDAVAAGINYSLGVSSTIGGIPSNPLAATGTGAAVDGYIIVTAPANQAGSCLGGCSATNTHYLTLEW